MTILDELRNITHTCPASLWPKQLVIDEFNKKFCNTILKIDNIFRHVKCIEDNYLFLDANEIKIKLDENKKIEICWPIRGLFTASQGWLFFLERWGRRQYRWAPSLGENCASQNILAHLKYKQIMRGMSPMSSRTQVFEDYFNHKDTSYYEALNNLNMGTALSREWGITIHPEDNNAVLLWYKQNLVASIKDDIINTNISNSFITQELTSFSQEFMNGKATINQTTV